MEQRVQDIAITLNRLLNNLGLELEDFDLTVLSEPELYMEIYKTMFPAVAPDIAQMEDRDDIEPGEKIDALIQILAESILRMDLSHIQGNLIAEGDKKHILNYLQLLYEISEMIVEKEESKPERKSGRNNQSSPNSANQSVSSQNAGANQKGDRKHSSQGNNHEYSADQSQHSQSQSKAESEAEDDSCVQEIANILNKKARGQNNKESASEVPPKGKDSTSVISEVSKSKESSVAPRLEDPTPDRDRRSSSKKKYVSHSHDNIRPEEVEEEYEEEHKGHHHNRKHLEPEGENIYQKISNEGGLSGEIDYYPSDPVNYHPMMQQNYQHGEHYEDGDRDRVIQEVREENEGSRDGRKSNKKRPQTGKPPKKPTGKPPKVEVRPLHTPPIVPPKETKKKGSSGKKSAKARPQPQPDNQRESSHGMVHSKSEKNLYQDGEEEYEGQQYEEGQEYVEGQEGEYQDGEQGEEGQEYPEDGLDERFEKLPPGNVYKILAHNIGKVKENLRGNKEIQNIPFDDEQTVQMIQQQKEHYRNYLNNFAKEHQMKQAKAEKSKNVSQKNFLKKVKSQRINDENLKRDFEEQQKGLYYKMRDEKVNYLRKIHKIIFELEKKRIIEEKKEYIEFRKNKNDQTRNIIESIKSEYKNKLDILREKNMTERNERKVASEAQKLFLQTLEHQIKLDQLKEIDNLKDRWNQEKQRFEMMIRDEGYLEQKIMELYKKGKF